MAPPAQPAAVAADDRAYARFATERALGVLAAWLEGAVATAVVAGAPGAGTTFVLRTVERRERGRRHVLFSPFLHIEPEALERWLDGLAFGSPPGSLDAWLAGAPGAPSLLLVDEAHAATPAALEALARLREARAPHLRICLGGCAGPALERAARSVGAVDAVVVELPPWSAEELHGFAVTLCALPPPGVEAPGPLAAVDPAALTAAAEGSPGLLRGAWSALRDLGRLPMVAAAVVTPASRVALPGAPVATPAVAPIPTSTPQPLRTRAPPPVTPPVAKPAEPTVPAASVVTAAEAPAPSAPEVPAPQPAARAPLPPSRTAASPPVATPAEPEVPAAPVATPAVAPIQPSTPQPLWTRAPPPVTPAPSVAKPAEPAVLAASVVTAAEAPAPGAPEFPAPQPAARAPLPPPRAAASPPVATPAEPAVSAVPVVTPAQASAPRAPEVPAPQPAAREPLPPSRTAASPPVATPAEPEVPAAPVATPAVAPIQPSTPQPLWTRAPPPVTPAPPVAKPAEPTVPAASVVPAAEAPAPSAPEVPAPQPAARAPLPAAREPLPAAREPLPPAREPLPPAREPLPPADVAAAPRPPPPAQRPPLRRRAPWYYAAALGIGFALGFIGGWQGWESWEAPAAAPEVPPEATTPAAVASAPPAEPTPALTYHDVQVNARPWAWIQIDGRPVGVTPLVHRHLASGEHEFEATFPDGRQQRRTVAIGPDSRFVSFQD